MTTEIKRGELGRTRLLVAAGGGEVSAIDQAGEVQWTVGVAPGIHEAKEYQDYMQLGWVLVAERGVTAMVTHGNRARPNPPAANAFESGANPDFRPTLVDAQERRFMVIEKRWQASEKRMARMLAEAQAQTARAEARAKAKPKPEEQIVQDETPEPVEEPAPAKPEEPAGE